MNIIERSKTNGIDWEEFGRETMLSSNEEANAIDVCRYRLHDNTLRLQPTITRLNFRRGTLRAQRDALQDYLYKRPVPVDDAALLTHATKIRIVLSLCLFMTGAALVGNFMSFRAFGWGIVPALVAAFFITALPIGVGHLLYETILAKSKMLQVTLVVVVAILSFAGFYEYGQSRRAAVDQATAQSATASYVNDDPGTSPPDQTKPPEGAEVRAKGALGSATLLFAAAAELALLYLFGLFIILHTDKTYVAWRKLEAVLEDVGTVDERLAEVDASIEGAKTQCMAGVRRAQDIRNKRRAPYHKALAIFVMVVGVCVLRSYSQTIDHEEGELLDTSISMARGEANRNLFRECLASTKSLLVSETPNTRVWVSTIATDSFGGVQEILTGWTPDVHGIFTDDLDRARRQLAQQFKAKTASLTPTAQGTDIFGGLWRMKTLFESVPAASKGSSKTIWIFSDMMNETEEFPMQKLLEIGPERLLERAKLHGLLVPMAGYEIHVYGASTARLAPQSWMTIKRFWEIYFAAAGAELMSYSTECEARLP